MAGVSNDGLYVIFSDGSKIRKLPSNLENNMYHMNCSNFDYPTLNEICSEMNLDFYSKTAVCRNCGLVF